LGQPELTLVELVGYEDNEARSLLKKIQQFTTTIGAEIDRFLGLNSWLNVSPNHTIGTIWRISF